MIGVGALSAFAIGRQSDMRAKFMQVLSGERIRPCY